MAFAPKYIATITINSAVYEYYGVSDTQLALIEQTPTLELKRNILQLIGYTLPHTVVLESLYKVNVQIPFSIGSPMYLPLRSYQLIINESYKRGGEAIVYKGTLNKHRVIIKTYIKGSRTLPQTSPVLAEYIPLKHLLFEDSSRAYFVVMEELEELVYNKQTLSKALIFLDLLEKIGARHGDISPGNIMQDLNGNLKFIDFSRLTTKGTPFYNINRTDRNALARTLLNYKYEQQMTLLPMLQEAIKERKPTLSLLYRTWSKSVINQNTVDLSDELAHIVADTPETPEHQRMMEQQFFDWFQLTFPQDEESLLLLTMAR